MCALTGLYHRQHDGTRASIFDRYQMVDERPFKGPARWIHSERARVAAARLPPGNRAHGAGTPLVNKLTRADGCTP